MYHPSNEGVFLQTRLNLLLLQKFQLSIISYLLEMAHTEETTNLEKHLPTKKGAEKWPATCLSCLYVDQLRSSQMVVIYISAHSGHELGPQELQHLSQKY